MMIEAEILKCLADGQSKRRWEIVKGVVESSRDSGYPADDAAVGEALDDMEQDGALEVSRVGCEASREAWLYSRAQNQEHKADAGKTLAGCLLEFGHALETMARISTHGAARYGRSTWQRVERQRYIDALVRHVLAMGADCAALDYDSNLPHLAHVMWNAAALLEINHEESPK